MAAGSASRILRAPGRLVVGPTDLGVAYPHGGTEIGLVRRVVLQALGRNFRVESELLGEATDVLESANRYVMACFLRGWDDDAIRLMLADHYDAGAVSGHAVLTVPNRQRPGASALTRAKSFLYVPDDPINAPALLIDRGIPEWTDGAELAFTRGDELGIPLVVDCLRSDAGRILQLGRLADLTL
mgnify:CR=1 FL=1